LGSKGRGAVEPAICFPRSAATAKENACSRAPREGMLVCAPDGCGGALEDARKSAPGERK